MIKLAPSILSADFAKLGEDVVRIDKAGCDWIHIDVMDGYVCAKHFLWNACIKAIRGLTNKFFDVHLMIEEPIRYLQQFKEAGADMVTVHVEACEDVEKTIDEIHKLGIKAGLACNPETPVDDIVPYINKVDMILIMTVHPGFGGQSYIDECTEKVEIVNAIVNEYRLDTLIQVDGGVNMENVCIPLDAGANVIVAGSAVYKGDVEKNIEVFKNKFISFE